MSATDGLVTKDIAGVTIEMIERGSGRPLLFLHPGIGIDPGARRCSTASPRARALIAPSHPGLRPLRAAARR